MGKSAKEQLFDRINDSLFKYPSLDLVIKRIEQIEDSMDSRNGHWDGEEELFDRLMDEWDELYFAYDIHHKLKTFEEWKDLGIHVTKGEKSKIRLNGKAVFHSTQTGGGYYSREANKWCIPRNRYDKWESPGDDDFAREMDYDLGGIEYYQRGGFGGD